eukprot:3158028-Pyramimonas_sp.AAC.1
MVVACSNAQAKNISTDAVSQNAAQCLCHASPQVHQRETAAGGHAEGVGMFMGARPHSCHRGDKH